MDSRQKKIALGVTLVVVLCWLTVPFWGSERRTDIPVSQAPLHFNAENAYKITSEFVTRNPRRVLGSLEARQAGGDIRNYLKRLNYQISSPTYFEAIIDGKRQPGTNIIALRPGSIPEILALVAHYDTARTTVQGAMDDGGGVGVMLELANVFSAAPLRHSLLIVASDGEEWGMLGAADFVESYPERQRIAAVLSLDWVAPGELANLVLETDGQRSGASPSWLRRVALKAAAMQGLPVISTSGIEEFFQRAIDLSLTDQGPFLHAGIPAINLSSGAADEARVRAIYHSADDTIGNLLPSSIGKYGQAAERILRSLDALTEIPPMDGAFHWHDDRYVAAWAMKTLHWLTFLPFAVMLVFCWGNARPGLTAKVLLPEILFFSAWMLSFFAFFSLVLFCRLMRLFPRSSLYPGPLHDPILENPAWTAVAVIAFVALIVGVSLHFTVRYLVGAQRRSFRAAKTGLMVLLAAVVALALFHDSYWAVAFLAMPALVWGAIGRGQSLAARVAGAVAIPSAGLTLYLQTITSERNLDAGIRIFWYAVLGLSNGVLSLQGYLLAAAVIVLGARFMTLQLFDTAE